MKLSNKEIQPYRIWYQYLQTALKDKKFSNKIDKNYYKDWHLNLVKKLTFNQWIKAHEHLFTQSDNTEIKLYEGKRTPNTLLIEIPINFNVQRIQNEIGKAVKGKVAKTQSNKRFKIQTNRPLQTAPLDYFLWAYEFKQSGVLKLKDIWKKVNEKVIDRQKKVAKRVDTFKKTGKGIRQRALTSGNELKSEKNKEVLISRNIKKAQNILTNVCKGIFPGEYSVR
jgi:hypothetical protein|tara:strand:+ start:783 stop:1454 length:672 start_codon:yes stop_codon:yes gene_type:complete